MYLLHLDKETEGVNASAVESSRLLIQLVGALSLSNCESHSLSEVAFPQPENSAEKIQPLKKQLSALGKENQVQIKLSRLKFKKLDNQQVPLAFKQKSGGYVVLARLSDDQALIQIMGENNPSIISRDELAAQWSGDIIQVLGPALRFDVSWFIPEFIRHRKLLGEVLFFSLMLQLLALVTPLFFQVVMDKVLVHNALVTLDVLVIVLVIVGIFEVVLKGIREYLFVHTSSRIDIRLGVKLFRHLLGLPLLYFKHRQVGAIITRVQELDSIRDFLTGSMLILCVDVLFTFVFFGVMYWISPILTLIVLVSLPFYFFLASWTTNPLQTRIEAQFQTAAINTSFLNESVSGAETVKSLAIEPQMQRKWEGQTQEMVSAGFNTQTLNGFISHCVMLLQKVTSVGIIWVGANLVMSLEITIGQLIAFNMMASHVSQPIAKLVELWQQFIQTRVAVDKLGDMLNLPTEQELANYYPATPLDGNIELSNLSFRYQPNEPNVLNNIHLSIKAGESLGIVGPSGSGKSTLARVLMKLFIPSEGDLLLDGLPLSKFSPEYLRSQIGVVLQENYLFHQSVRENIALKDPSASLDDVVASAKLAGAHEFILQLPKGYDSILAEGGSSLSGGQRQRIAIARALMANPRILIFDEATSALDDKSQSLIQNNMKSICAGRTVITIAHRLTTVRHCDRIITLDKGRITESGNHDELLALNGTYAGLWQLQQELREE